MESKTKFKTYSKLGREKDKEELQQILNICTSVADELILQFCPTKSFLFVAHPKKGEAEQMTDKVTLQGNTPKVRNLELKDPTAVHLGFI